MEEFRSKYPEWCVLKESEKKESNGGHPAGLRIDSGLNSSTTGSSRNSGGLRPMNRRPGSLGSRSASDSEEERPDSSLDPADGHPAEFGSGFSLGLSVGLRLGLESEPLPLDAMDHCVDVDPDPGFPVEILPYLFLGNAQNSSDCDALDRHHIRVSYPPLPSSLPSCLPSSLPPSPPSIHGSGGARMGGCGIRMRMRP